jgi:opacity protein-like surface antigen
MITKNVTFLNVRTGKSRMKKRYIVLSVLAVLAAGGSVAAYTLSPKVHSGQPGEAPELGVTGKYNIGTATQDFTLPSRTQITASGALTGNLVTGDRKISVRFWYPAVLPKNAARAVYSHEM